MPRRAGLEADLDRVAAARRGALAGERQAAADLLGWLAVKSPLLREAAAQGAAAVARAQGGAWPGNPEDRGAAAAALLAAIDAAAAGGARADPGCRVRQEAVIALGELGGAGTGAAQRLRVASATVQMENVGGAMEDTAVTLRANAALAMAQLRCDCLPELGLLLFDGLPDAASGRDAKRAARLGAARALGLLGEPAAAALLLVRLHEPREDGEVLAACIDALVALRHPRAACWIRPLLGHPDGTVQVAAASGFGLLEPAAAVAAIMPRIPAAPDWLAEALVLALAGIRSDGVAAALERLAQQPRRAIRQAARAALGLPRAE